MLTVAARSMTAPAVALAATGVVALAPVALAPVATVPSVTTSAGPALVHVDDVALTGIGQDIYYAVTPVVQYVVGGVSYLINFLPIVGAPVAAQININYFQGIQPIVEATVNYLAAVVQDPLNIVGATAAYGSTLFDIGYNWVSAQAQFFGLPPLAPLPQTPARVTSTPTPPASASVDRPARRGAATAARPARVAASAAGDAARRAADADTGSAAKKARSAARTGRGAAG